MLVCGGAVLIGNHDESTANLQVETEGCWKSNMKIQVQSEILQTKPHLNMQAS